MRIEYQNRISDFVFNIVVKGFYKDAIVIKKGNVVTAENSSVRMYLHLEKKVLIFRFKTLEQSNERFADKGINNICASLFVKRLFDGQSVSIEYGDEDMEGQKISCLGFDSKLYLENYYRIQGIKKSI